MKAIIVDDEKAARNILNNLIKLSFPDVEIVSSEVNVPDAVIAIKKHRPDLVFLDIEMPRYAGYEIAKFFDTIDFHIIFVTAYDKYAIKAFELNAVDYILKPIERKRLELAINKVVERIKSGIINANYHELLDVIEQENSKSITVSEQTKTHVIPISNIIGIEAHGAYSTIHCVDNKLTISKNIGYFDTLLEKENIFFRSHKSWMVNIKHLENYSKGNGVITLKNNVITKLSRFKKATFETLINESRVMQS